MATKTRTIQRFRLEEIADLANVYDYSIRTYSGRGMYGAECVGVVLDSQRDVYRFLVAMGSLLTESADENVADPTEEAMEMAGRLTRPVGAVLRWRQGTVWAWDGRAWIPGRGKVSR